MPPSTAATEGSDTRHSTGNSPFHAGSYTTVRRKLSPTPSSISVSLSRMVVVSSAGGSAFPQLTPRAATAKNAAKSPAHTPLFFLPFRFRLFSDPVKTPLLLLLRVFLCNDVFIYLSDTALRMRCLNLLFRLLFFPSLSFFRPISPVPRRRFRSLFYSVPGTKNLCAAKYKRCISSVNNRGYAGTFAARTKVFRSPKTFPLLSR